MASDGDPRVHFVLNLVLSTLFVYVTLRGLDFVGAAGFSIPRWIVGTLVVMVLTYVVTG